MDNLQVRLADSSTPDLNIYFETLGDIKGLLELAGLPSAEASVLAMHLAEIDEEASRYRQLISRLRSADRTANGSNDALLEPLIDIEISLEHMKSHIEAMSDLLSASLDALDTDDEE